MKAVLLRKHGGPEVLEYSELSIPEPGYDQVRVRLKAIGVNTRDAYIRAGIYNRELPVILGIEGAGVVDAVGPGVTGWAAGDRVAYYVADILGAYSEYQVVPKTKLVKLPAELSYQDAASMFDHGLTAHYLTTSTFPLGKGHRVLIQAAAGSIGRLLIQLAKRFGATVYGTVSTPEKADLIKKIGADEAIIYRDTDVAKAVSALTDGKGVHVVYDSVGKDTIQGSVRSLAKRGTLVLYGAISGPVPTIIPMELADAGSLFFTRPHLAHHIATQEELNQRSQDIFSWFLQGEISLNLDKVYPLSDVAEAHRRLDDKSNTGKMILVP